MSPFHILADEEYVVLCEQTEEATELCLFPYSIQLPKKTVPESLEEGIG